MKSRTAMLTDRDHKNLDRCCLGNALEDFKTGVFHAMRKRPPIEWDCPRCGAKAKAVELRAPNCTQAGFRVRSGKQTARPNAPLAIGDE